MTVFDPEEAVRSEVVWMLGGEGSQRFIASPNPEAAAMLAYRMAEISEHCYCAGWETGCEHALWSMLASPEESHEWGMQTVEPAELAMLAGLSKKCGGWIVWGERGETWIALADWLRVHAEWAQGKRGEQ